MVLFNEGNRGRAYSNWVSSPRGVWVKPAENLFKKLSSEQRLFRASLYKEREGYRRRFIFLMSYILEMLLVSHFWDSPKLL